MSVEIDSDTRRMVSEEDQTATLYSVRAAAFTREDRDYSQEYDNSYAPYELLGPEGDASRR
jgi:hypothetical protein